MALSAMALVSKTATTRLYALDIVLLLTNARFLHLTS
jgi:hypothetical protein